MHLRLRKNGKLGDENPVAAEIICRWVDGWVDDGIAIAILFSMHAK
jgi:hypothetical protein